MAMTNEIDFTALPESVFDYDDLPEAGPDA